MKVSDVLGNILAIMVVIFVVCGILMFWGLGIMAITSNDLIFGISFLFIALFFTLGALSFILEGMGL